MDKTYGLKPGEQPILQVNAQVPRESDPITATKGFAKIMRVAPAYRTYNGHAESDGTQRLRTQSPAIRSATPVRASPAPSFTFVSEVPEDLTTCRPTKRRKTEEPAPKPQRYKFTNKKAILNSSRPVRNSNEIHNDSWSLILSFCHPRFLLSAKTINSNFYHILKQESLWRESRKSNLKKDTPECPSGVTEQQYTDLLVGRGCQSASCDKENTVSVCWAILARFCPGCLRSRTASFDELPRDRQHILPNNNQKLCDVLPMLYLSASHRGEFRELRVDANGTMTYADNGRGSPYRFSRSAYKRLEAEYLEMQAAGIDDNALNEWWQTKYDSNMAHMKERQAISTWCFKSSTDPSTKRQEREAFFVDKAKKLDPPMSRSLLEHFTAYKKALLSHNDPSDRSWETLRKKIEPIRRDAEVLEMALKRPDTAQDPLSGIMGTYEKLQTHRDGSKQSSTLTPEQDFVEDLGKQVLQQVLKTNAADSDIVLLTLKEVYERYQAMPNKPKGLNFDGEVGTYQLSMDDARTIVRDIGKVIPESSQRGLKVFGRFTCPACLTEKERGKSFYFSSLFDHLLNVHGKTVGEGPEFWRYALAPHVKRGSWYYHHLSFPWLTVPWPRCLPVLPEHQHPKSLASWEPDLDRPYVRETMTYESAFERRRAKVNPACSSFLDLLSYASRKLSGLRLESPVMTRIALQYAIDASDQQNFALSTLQEFVDAAPTIQQGNSAMEFRFRCGACMRQENVRQSARHVKHRIPVADLQSHWVRSHRPEPPMSPTRRRRPMRIDEDAQHWTEDFMHLPSDTEVLEQMIASDDALAKEKADVQASLDNPKRKPKAKAPVILATRSSRDVFDELFEEVA